jgi:glucose/arabinose dehydrogenase
LSAAVLVAALAPIAAAAGAERPQRRDAPTAKPAVMKKVASFDDPTYVTGAPGFPNLLFVSQRAGQVMVVEKRKKQTRPFLDISARVNEGRIEQGLLGLAFPPDYRKSGRFYVQYTDANDDLQIDEFRRSSPTFAPASSRRAVLTAPEPDGYTNHNGGQLLFRGNLLYSGIGDGMDPGDLFNYAQSLDNLRGKIIRINPRPTKGGRPYGVPRTNPFVGRPGRDEIYSYGLRNPFRFSFQEVKGAPDRLVVGDVGENRFEEIDYEDLRWAWGGNFGWDAFEGDSPYDSAGPCGIFCPNGDTPDPGNTLKPVLTYPHGPRCAVIGGYVVRDPALNRLFGRYLYSDYCGGRIRSFEPRLSGAVDDRPTGLRIPPGRFGGLMTSFGEDTFHHIYAATTNGPVYRLAPPPARKHGR